MKCVDQINFQNNSVHAVSIPCIVQIIIIIASAFDPYSTKNSIIIYSSGNGFDIRKCYKGLFPRDSCSIHNMNTGMGNL